MSILWHDLRLAVRVLLRSRGSTLLSVLTLALGIGANTAIFSVISSVLITPLPYREPGRIVTVWEKFRAARTVLARVDLEDYARAPEVFVGPITAFEPGEFDLTGAGNPERISGYWVSATLFSVLGINAQTGRTFVPGDGNADAPGTVVLGHGLWQRRFGGDPNILGRKLTLNGGIYTVVGVMPKSFSFPPPLPLGRHTFFAQTELWAPLRMEQANPLDHRFFSIARLAPGVSLAQATARLNGIARRLDAAHAHSGGAALVPIETAAVEHVRQALLVLLGAVALVLLMSCANVANLLMVRAAGRQREVAVRLAMGASRSRILRQLMTESIVLSITGGICGLLLAAWGLRGANQIIPEDLRYFHSAAMDPRVLAFALGISALTALMFGLIPAHQIFTSSLVEPLKHSGRSVTAGAAQNRWRHGLVVAEITVAVILLIGAGLLLRSFSRMLDVKLGFQPGRVLTLGMNLPSGRYASPQQWATFFGKALKRLSAIPGVEAVGGIEQLPIGGGRLSTYAMIEGRSDVQTLAEAPMVEWYTVTPGYFQSMRIPLQRGRFLVETDAAANPPVALISQAAAERFWPKEEPVGKHIRLQRGRNEGWSAWMTVVGVVDDVRRRITNVPVPTIYLNWLQNPTPEMTFALCGPDPLALAAPARAEIAALDPDLVIGKVQTMRQILLDAVAQPHFRTLLLAVFASIALLLAIIGSYGVVSFSVAQRTRDMGIRIALGASRTHIQRLVLLQTIKQSGAGIALGLLAAAALMPVLKTFLFGVDVFDPVIFLGVPLVLAAAALLAGYIPARRAARVDPAVSLRFD